MSTFNAWSDPWLPVDGQDSTSVVSLRDLFLRAHLLKRLGPGLTPLDRDSIYRLLASLAAVILRECTDEEWDDVDESRFPARAVDAFEERFHARFALLGEKPFLQRWDRTQADLAALFSLDVDDKKERTARLKARQSKLQPLGALHQHVPGGSSSKWAVRRDDRDVSDASVLTILLVTAWFQTKFGNGKDPWGQKSVKGSAGTWHVNPLAIYLTDPTHLGRTILANVPEAWVDKPDLPLFLDHTLPEEFAEEFAGGQKTSVARFTYAKTLPLVYFEDESPIGFVSGADADIFVPDLGGDVKESLSRVHEHDHTRLYVRTARKQGGEELVPRGALGVRLTTTEGFERWFRADNGINQALRNWHGLQRVLLVEDAALRDWKYSIFSDMGDPHGNRHWTAWDEVPADFAGASGGTLRMVQSLLLHASDYRSRFVHAGRLATGESDVPPVVLAGQAAFYAAVTPILLEVADEVHHGVQIDVERYTLKIARAALREFERATEPLLVPARVADVARARAVFARLVHRDRSRRLTDQPRTKEIA